MANMRFRLLGNLFMAALLAGAAAARAEDSAWVDYFNGKDLNDWDFKFAGHPAGENYNKTFTVTDGILNVDYSGWTAFGVAFGHAINKTRTWSYYLLRAEYQVVGNKQCPGTTSSRMPSKNASA